MVTPPTALQVEMRAKESWVEGTRRMRSVNIKLTSRLKDPTASKSLEVVVDTVLHVSQFRAW
jgi:hypothetical protein